LGRLNATVGLARTIKPGRMRSIRGQVTPKTWKSEGTVLLVGARKRFTRGSSTQCSIHYESIAGVSRRRKAKMGAARPATKRNNRANANAPKFSKIFLKCQKNF